MWKKVYIFSCIYVIWNEKTMKVKFFFNSKFYCRFSCSTVKNPGIFLRKNGQMISNKKFLDNCNFLLKKHLFKLDNSSMWIKLFLSFCYFHDTFLKNFWTIRSSLIPQKLSWIFFKVHNVDIALSNIFFSFVI